MDNDELMHYGVPGMKWGVRRYQRKDGSLTSAGKKRYSGRNETDDLSTEELRKKVNRMNMEKRYIDLTRPSSRVSRVSDRIENVGKSAGDINKAYKSVKGDKDPKGVLAGQTIDGVGKSARLAKKIDSRISDKKHIKESRKKLDNMTDDDLARQVDRLDLERQYSRLKESTISSGKMKATEILSIAGDVAAIGASAATIAVGIQKLRRGR